jgi:flavin-binding protein dodecin
LTKVNRQPSTAEGQPGGECVGIAGFGVSVKPGLAHLAGLAVQRWRGKLQLEEELMADSVYRVTEVVGVSSDSWEQAAKSAVDTVGQSVRDLRIAEVIRQDVTIEDGKISGFRVRLGVSFKYEKQ